jgi:hypothetical protein
MTRVLTQPMIEAAKRLHDSDPRLDGWRLSSEAILSVKDKYPGFDETSCVVKTVAINSLYSTQIYWVLHVAKHVARIMGDRPDDQSLVAALADAGAGKRHLSFASKFAHFFVCDRFPIYDSAAIVGLKFYLCSNYRTNALSPYDAYRENIASCLRSLPSSSYSQSVDQCLWLTGSWIKWKEDNRSGNAELRALFEFYPPDLHEMLPDELR